MAGMVLKKLFGIIAGVILSLTGVSAEFCVPGTETAPQIDGIIDAAEWSRALVLAGAGTPVDQRKSQCFISFDAGHIYVAVQSELPPKGKLASGLPYINCNDSIELWFDPPKELRTIEQGKFGEFQLIASFKNELQMLHHNPGYGLPSRTWKIDDFQMKNHLDGKHWNIELAIPAKAFGLEKITDSDWKLMAVRNFGTHLRIQAPFSPCNAFSDTQSFATFHLRANASAIRNLYQDRLPLKIESDADELEISGSVNGKPFTGRTPFVIPADAREPGEIKFTVKDRSGQVLMSREVSYAAPQERLWFMPEAYISLEQDYESGDAGQFTAANPGTQIVKAANAAWKIVPGRTDDSKALYLEKSAQPFYYYVAGTPIPVPGNISLWIKPDKLEKPSEWRRYFSSGYRKTGYFGMQIEKDGYGHIFLLEFGAPQHLMISRLPVADAWSHVSVNIEPNRIEYYLNGVKQGEQNLPFAIDPDNLGEFTIGGGDGSFAIDEYQLYTRTLEADEIKNLAQGEKSISGEIGYYPSLNAIVLDVNVNAEKTVGKSLIAEVRDSRRNLCLSSAVDISKGKTVQTDDSRTVVLHQTIPLAQALEEGTYNLLLHFADEEEILLEKNILVKHYPWEKNNLGKEDRLLPGFTELKADGNRLSCVLRQYEIGDNGLPCQISSMGENLLASPVTLKAEKDGAVKAIGGGTFAVVSQTDTKIVYQSTGGSCSVQGSLEQDGLLKFDIAFPEAIDADRVFLDIPVKKEIATLYHAIGEYVRANPAGFIPPGTGRVFNSRSISQIHVSNFIPYIWVGSDERGICYAADWDKGWIHSAKYDAVELHRNQQGDVIIRLNLLNGPIPPKPGRVITLALMASPVKPMPEGWRGWSDSFDAKSTRLTKCLQSPPYWGAFQDWAQRYPTWGDFEYVRKLKSAKDTGVIDYGFIEQWLEKLGQADKADVPWLAAMDKENARVFARNHINAGFAFAQSLHNHPNANLYYYTCDTENLANLPEFPAYADEWSALSGVAGSFQDYAIYYLDKMLENGMEGVYNDNTFFRCCDAWATGNAYIDDEGNVKPSFCLWESREYRRRELNLMLNHGLNPWITVHHTNANILPSLGFATNSMGMEWKYGTQDFQERFTPDYIRAVCQGLQGGLCPTVLDGITGGSAPERQWATRTMLASLLPHEIRPTWPRGSDPVLVAKAFDILFDFGRHEKDCVYTAYWNSANPVAPNDRNLLVSTYSRGGKLLCVCGSFTDDLNAVLSVKGKVDAAVNAETGEKLEVTANQVKFFLKKHDFIIVEIQLAK